MKNLFGLLSIFLLVSCSQDDTDYIDPSVDYYKFSAADKKNLIDSSVKEGKTITYKNQRNESLSYQVAYKYIARRENGHGTFSGGNFLMNYYDEQYTQMQLTTDTDNYADLQISIVKTSNSGMKIDFNFNLWNVNGYAFGSDDRLHFFFPQNGTPMTVNGTEYKKVVTLQSGSNEVNPGDPNARVNKLYYDINKGIIGFDDIDGSQWRIVN